MKILILAMLLMVTATAQATEGDNQCLQGVRAAYEAYLLVTYDAKYPDMEKLAYMLDYRISQQPFPVDVAAAKRALIFIATKQRDAGDRQVDQMHVSISAESFIDKECTYHGR